MKIQVKPHICIEKQINKYMNLSSERSMSTSGLEPLKKPMLHHQKTLKNYAISLKIELEILFMIQIPRT